MPEHMFLKQKPVTSTCAKDVTNLKLRLGFQKSRENGRLDLLNLW